MKELEDMQNYELFTVITAGINILRENERKQGYEDGLGVAQTDSYVKGYGRSRKTTCKSNKGLLYGTH